MFLALDFTSFEPWLWIILFSTTIIIELITVDLFCVWFSAGALVAFILDACNVPFGYQVGAFIVVSIALLVTVGKWTRKLLKGRVETNVDALVGQEIIILKDTSYRDVGEAKINGVIWSTICVEDETIKEGSIAIIQEIKGNKLYIKSK